MLHLRSMRMTKMKLSSEKAMLSLETRLIQASHHGPTRNDIESKGN
jgi:hypothetical protein